MLELKASGPLRLLPDGNGLVLPPTTVWSCCLSILLWMGYPGSHFREAGR